MSTQKEIEQADEVEKTHFKAPAWTVARAAKNYYDKGYKITPLMPNSKKAFLKDWPNRELSADEISSEWQDLSKGIGLLLGQSGMAALDIDQDSESRIALEAVGINLDDLLSAKGIKVFTSRSLKPLYLLPSGFNFEKKVLKDPKTKKVIFELRTGNSQEVLPPTIHPDTKQAYIWFDVPAEQEGLPSLKDFQPLPDSLNVLWRNWGLLVPVMLQALGHEVPKLLEGKSNSGGKGVSQAYIQKIYTSELETLANTQEGGRNDQLFKATAKLFGIVADNLLDAKEVKAKLIETAIGIELDPAEIQATINSGIKHGLENPRGFTIDPGKVSENAQIVAKSNLHFYTLKDLDELPEVSWLVNDVFPANALAMLYGSPGCGKTFVALDIALCIASSKGEWHSYKCDQGKVFYIAGEGIGGIKRRIDAWRLHHKVSEDISFELVTGGSNLLRDDEYSDLATIIEKLETINEPVKLVVIDTLARHFGAANENDAMEMNRFIQACDKIRTKTSCTVMIVHHLGKNAKSGARGSSALLAAVDTSIEVENEPGLITCANKKQKDAEEFPLLRFSTKQIELPSKDEVKTSLVLERHASLTINGKEINTELDADMKLMFDVLNDTFSEPIINAEWKTAYNKERQKRGDEGLAKSTFQDKRDKLIKYGYIETHGGEKNIKYSAITSKRNWGAEPKHKEDDANLDSL